MLSHAPCGSASEDRPQSLTERFERLPGAALIDELRIERGASGDYQQLASFHYKSGRPGAVTAVYRMVHRAPTVVGRFVGRSDETTIVGVLIRSLPSWVVSFETARRAIGTGEWACSRRRRW